MVTVCSEFLVLDGISIFRYQISRAVNRYNNHFYPLLSEPNLWCSRHHGHRASSGVVSGPPNEDLCLCIKDLKRGCLTELSD